MRVLATIFLGLFYMTQSGLSQPDSEQFPDFTHTDITGETHHLYDYLDDGKTVIIDVFATWCPICIGSLPALHEIDDEYGPNGNNTIQILSFERDPNTSNEAEFVQNYNVTTPVISEAVATVQSWNTVYQPNYFVICPDRSFDYYFGGIGSNADILLDKADQCSSVTAIDTSEKPINAQLLGNPVYQHLSLNVVNKDLQMNIMDLTGKSVQTVYLQSGLNTLDVSSLNPGVYIIRLVAENGDSQALKIIKK